MHNGLDAVNTLKSAKLPQSGMNLILELGTIYTLSLLLSLSCLSVAALDHEPGQQAMELRAVVIPFQAKLDEVLARQRRFLRPELNFQRTVRSGHDYFGRGRRFLVLA